MAKQSSAKSQSTKGNEAASSTATKELEHPVTDKLNKSLHASVDELANRVGITEENIRKNASSSAENMSARKRLAAKKWHASKVRKYAIENPVATAGIAFAAGMLITSLLRKK